MVLDRPGTPLTPREWPVPQPGEGEILIEVTACGVCRTDLHVVDGELPDPKLPIVPGHEIVGGCDRFRRQRFCAWRARRRALARLRLRRLSVLPLRTRKSVRCGLVHRLHA